MLSILLLLAVMSIPLMVWCAVVTRSMVANSIAAVVMLTGA